MAMLDTYLREFFPYFANFEIIYYILEFMFILGFFRILMILPLYALGGRKRIW